MTHPPNIKYHKIDADRMRKLRTDTGSTQVQWAAMLGVSERTVRAIEGGAPYDYATQYLAESTRRMYE